jgi:protoporphyrinogen oxidase
MLVHQQDNYEYTAQSIQTEADRVVSVLTQEGKIDVMRLYQPSPSELSKIIPANQVSCMPNISQVQYIGVVCAILSLKQPFSRNFWMNINDPGISFNGIIEQSNSNHTLKSANLNLIYIPFYMPTELAFSTNGDQILAEYRC